jgi:hypothetical protein
LANAIDLVTRKFHFSKEDWKEQKYHKQIDSGMVINQYKSNGLPFGGTKKDQRLW